MLSEYIVGVYRSRHKQLLFCAFLFKDLCQNTTLTLRPIVFGLTPFVG